MGKKDRFLSGWNPFLLLACVLLSAVLAGFLIWNYQKETTEKLWLKAAAAQEQAGDTVYEE